MTASLDGVHVVPALAALGLLAVLVCPAAARSRVGAAAGVAVGVAGLVTGLLTSAGPVGRLQLPTLLPGTTLVYAPDRLGGLFLVLVGAVTAVASLWAGGGAHGAAATRTAWVAFLVFVTGLMGVMAAADVVAFLGAWEVMAVASAVLVLVEYRRGATVTSAGLWYAAMTQLSFLLVLAGFAVLAQAASGTSFEAIARLDPHTSAATIGVVLLVVGFAAKAGAVPLHVWLPRAHPEAPSHVSAVMSAAMVKAGIYGVLLVLVRLVPGGPQGWGLLVLALGAASAVFGILQASVAADLKRLLAYSTTENIGLILCAIGVSQVFTAHGQTTTAHAALVAAVLLSASHAAAKTALFLTAGSVLHATGQRDLDRLGGLWTSMPWTCSVFGIAAVGAAGLPVSAGFVAEWTLLQALIHAGPSADPLVAVTTAATVTVVALTAGLALLTFTKAFGIAFLGRSRSAEAAGAHEVGLLERAAGVVAAGAVLLLGLVPGPLAVGISHVVGGDSVTDDGTTWGTGLRLTGLPGAVGRAVSPVLDPVGLAGLAVILTVVGLAVGSRLRHQVPRREVDLAWGCGGIRVSPRMQYTATSYAEPLVRVFDGVLGVARTVESRSVDGSPYLEQEVRFAQRLVDVVERRLYDPVTHWAMRCGDAARRLQNGSINRYLMFSFGALLTVLVAVSR